MVTKIGSEIVVNAASDTHPQESPEVAALSGGGFVETWIDAAPTHDVRAQILDASGNKVGAEIDLGVTPADVVLGVTGLANNAFAISWGEVGINAGVKIQLFDSAGHTSGGPIGPLPSPSGGGGEPALTTLTDGDLAVIFEYNSTSGAAEGGTFDTSGNPTGSFVAGTAPNPGDLVFGQQIAPLSTGGAVAVWQEIPESGIFAQRLDTHGTLVGSQIPVTTLAVENAVVTPLANGAFVVAWDDGSSVQAERFAADGSPVGGPFQVNTNTASFVEHPGIATLANGQFVVVWRDLPSSGNGSVEGQVFNADGSKAGAEFTVATSTSRSETISPKVAALAHDEFVVTWDDPGSTDGVTNTIHAQIFSASGSAALPTVRFTARAPVNMKKLPGLQALLSKHLVIAHESKTDIKGAIGSFSYDFKNAPGHAFTFHHKTATDGIVGSFSVSVNGALAYKFTGLAMPVTTLNGFIHSHKSIASLTGFLLSENNVVTGSRGNDVLIGGPNDNTFVFTKRTFGHDTIMNFLTGDVIELSHKIFHSLAQVEHHAHVVHGHVQIRVDAADTITLNTVHHVSDLTPGDFLFV